MLKLLVMDKKEQATLGRIRQLRADGYSIQAIADTLTTEGYETKTGKRWHATTVRRLLQRMSLS
jgi:hypothetical protein